MMTTTVPNKVDTADSCATRGSIPYLLEPRACWIHLNTSWLIGRHGHLTPKEAYRTAQATAAA
jgi:hypothetical protein